MEHQTPAYKAIEAAGGKSAVAERFGISYEAVRQWVHSGVPPRRVMALSRMAEMAPWEVAPDVFGDPGKAA